MVKHIVMFKLNNKTRENMDAAVLALEGMKEKIEILKFIEVGTDITQSERSCDIVLTTHFDNIESLKKYSAHPMHKPVIEIMRNLCANIMAVDYETDN